MRPPVEGDQVVFTARVEGDVADHHDLLVVLLTKEGVDDVVRLLSKPGEDLGVEPGHPLRRLHQTLALGVLADRLENLADRVGDRALVDLSRLARVHVRGWAGPRG